MTRRSVENVQNSLPRYTTSSSLSIGVTSLSSFAFLDVMSLSTGVLSGQNHQAIDKTPVDNDTSKKVKLDNEVTPIDNDDVIFVDTSSSTSMNSSLMTMSSPSPSRTKWPGCRVKIRLHDPGLLYGPMCTLLLRVHATRCNGSQCYGLLLYRARDCCRS